eukprot:Lithocolla_globosa_v1_NODE_1074_length_2895_cov_15.340845.p2 type:complete len:369 gc:universal NODE_1074_length_2895_cov_15.340845:1694-2800(+)
MCNFPNFLTSCVSSVPPNQNQKKFWKNKTKMAALGGSLFPNDAAAQQKKHLVEFKAGRMFMEGTTVKPDKRKGLVYMEQGDDSLMHFCWKDRTTGAVEEDLILFPVDAEFKHVPQCKTGRVYLLKFSSTDRKLFFWLQEPKDTKDEENCQKVNNLINNPPTPGSSADPLEGLGGGINREQLMQWLAQGAAGQGSPSPAATTTTTTTATTTTTTTTTTTASTTATTSTAAATTSVDTATAMDTSSDTTGPVSLETLKSVLANITPTSNIDLSNILTVGAVSSLLKNKDLCKELFPFLPPNHEHTASEIEDVIKSPQFKEACQTLNAALQQGQLETLLVQLGLDPVVGGAQGGLEAFLAAIQSKEDKEKK